MSARDDILGRIRGALEASANASVPPIERTYRQSGSRSSAARLDLLADRLVDYRALVRRCSRADLDACVAAALESRGVKRVVVPARLGLSLPDDLEVLVDEGQLAAADLDGCDAVVTRAAIAIAETGTIVLDASPDQGRRAITLVPDYHLCIVAVDQVVETVAEALTALSPVRPLTWISGPSATSDIELSRVEGVHGPRTLEVVLTTG